MTQEQSPQQIVLLEGEGPGRIAVNFDAYLAFCEDMSDRVDELVREWSHLAAPQALFRSERLR